MKNKLKLILFIAGLLAATGASAQNSDALKVKVRTLDNGLTVWLNEDPNQTAIYGAVVVKAGAVDCPGTGIAHYFEHMMFKGTDKIGTVDYAAEKPYLDSIAAAYDRLALAESDSVRNEIQMEINRLSVKAADFAIPNEFNNLISEMGGSDLNAFTAFDQTVYHNKFLPEYFEQWAELNSERIMNPVFRLFQSELETVYEEKNRSDDNLISDFQNTMIGSIYAGTGYAQPVIGTTANLKNPSLSQMREFFEKYYVASNMGLVLTGNFREEDVMPVIARTFGRIRKGEPNVRPECNLKPIEGRQDVTAMMNMPIVKVNAICFRGPSKRDADYLGVSLMTSMLNNDAGTGLLDKLSVEHKLLMATAMPGLSFRDAGAILVLYIPKILFQSDKKASDLILDEFRKLREGDFSDDFFESCKLSFRKALISSSEDLAGRMENMAFAFSEDVAWDDILAQPDIVDGMTRDDIIALANKYLSDDCIFIHKKTGMAPKDDLKKPAYEKVVPKNKEAYSAYAQSLRSSAEKISVVPKAVDYEKDAVRVEISPLAHLYAVSNPYNDVFQLTLSYAVGTNQEPALERVAAYTNLLGTDTKNYDDIHNELQAMGSSIYFTAGQNSFEVSIDGFDRNLEKTMDIASDLMKNIAGDSKKLRSCKSDEKSANIMNRSDMNTLSNALLKKACIGDNSDFLTDKGAYKDEVLLGLFHKMQKTECDVLYSGNADPETVAQVAGRCFGLTSLSEDYDAPTDFEPVKYDGPQILFLDKKDASQSQIYCLVASDKAESQYDRYFASVFGSYLGGGMSSLLFQEIREFRSMAYATGGTFRKPNAKNRSEVPMTLISFVGTQSDKTIDAMKIVDSLITRMPFMETKLDVVKKEELNYRCNGYPDFRQMPAQIADDLRNGFTTDPVDVFMQVINDMDSDSAKAFWEKYVAGRDLVWCIVGNAKKVDMEALSAYGPVTMLKAKDVIR